jgi:aminoglycoside phosphotransferase (APT) family kinase protein
MSSVHEEDQESSSQAQATAAPAPTSEPIAETAAPAPAGEPVVETAAPAPPAEPIVEGAEPHLVGPLLASELHDSRWAHCDVALISGGKSNLTYRVRSDAGEVILRRPPLGHVLPTAHDMGREYRVLSALYTTAVPVPRTLLLAGQDSELGVQFYVMERVVGHICRDGLPNGYAMNPREREAIGDALIDLLAALHSIDPESVGLADFGRPEGFMERQLRRWSEQWERSKMVELPALDALRDHLGATLPKRSRVAIVHGDYRLDNTMLHPTRPGEIVAVLDWEMSTLGDPLADLGALLAYWSEDDDDAVLVRARIVPPVTAAAGFPSRDAVVERYAQRTGFDVSRLGWYRAFAFFKLAIICQGIAARVAGGAMLGPGFDLDAGLVESLVEAGQRYLDHAGA